MIKIKDYDFEMEQLKEFPFFDLSFLATINAVSNSFAEPIAISRNLAKSLSLDLAAPSDIFNGTDVAARRVWEVKPYISDFGYCNVKK